MKYLILILIAIFCISMSLNKNPKEYPSRAEKTVNTILSFTSKQIEKAYPLQVCGMGSAMPEGNIKELCLSFTTKETMGEHRLRQLLVEISNILLQNINQNKDIEQFLFIKPFTIKNVQIILYNHDTSGRSSFDPNITTAQISEGILTYRIVESQKNFVLKKEFIETYDEALKLVKLDMQ